LTWQHLSFPGNPYITAVRIHPKNFNIVFTISESVLFISRNQGTTWQEISNYPFGDRLYDLEFDPNDPNILYVVTPGYFGKYSSLSSVYRSTDGGIKWERIFSTSCCGEANPPNIEIDQSNGNRIYVTINNGFFRSTDGGKKWVRLKTGNPNPFVSLEIDPLNGKKLFAASYKALYKTTDGGNTWSFAGTKCVPNISIDPKNPQNIYSVGALDSNPGCGVRSRDGGQSWQSLDFPHLTPTDIFGAIAVSPSKPNVVLASSDLLYRSVNSGRSWITISNGKGILQTWVTVNSKTIPDVYAYNYNRLFASFANRKWRLLRTPPTFGIIRLLISIQDPSMLIAGGSHIPFVGSADESLIVSSDGGNKWKYQRGPFAWVQELVMDLYDSNKLYAAGNVGSNQKLAMARSKDFGKTWETVVTSANGSYPTIRIDPMNSSVLYASSYDGLLRSTDSGKTWHLYGNVPSGKDIISMDIAPQHFYLLMLDPLGETDTHFVYRSDDGGLNFQLKNQGLPTTNLYFVKVHPTNPSTVFVGSDKGLFISNNDGENWELFKTAGLPQYSGIVNLAIPFSQPNQYFVGAYQGVFSYTNK